MVRWVGFKQSSITVSHAARYQGKSTYSLKRLFNLGLDIVLAYSDKPIRIAIKWGILVSSFALLAAVYNLYLFFMDQISVPGYTSLAISIWFLSGVIISILGLVGLYVGKIFEGVKRRPLYIVSEVANQ